MTQSANYINHVGVVADESFSMLHLRDAVIKVSDTVTAHLAERSQHYDQETRITYYTFADAAKCLFYDKDVLRMPSVAGLYKPAGNTALIDTVMLAISDLEKTAQLYGDHAFLLYFFSDGQDNRSRTRPTELAARIALLPSNWTIAGFAPHQQAIFDLKRCGFPAGNLAVWDALTTAGVEEMGAVIRDSSDAFMAGRAQGVRGYSGSTASGGLFRMGDVSLADVKSAAVSLTAGSYEILEVMADEDIRDFVNRHSKRGYQVGKAYYELTARSKPVLVQEYKGIFVETGGLVYGGAAIRSLLKLPAAGDIRLKGNEQPGCTVFIESRSYNRKLIAGTRLLLLR
jgi:hypothetical protein